eukprot:3425514-Pleurochrysis_carterae.AAC.1
MVERLLGGGRSRRSVAPLCAGSEKNGTMNWRRRWLGCARDQGRLAAPEHSRSRPREKGGGGKQERGCRQEGGKEEVGGERDREAAHLKDGGSRSSRCARQSRRGERVADEAVAEQRAQHRQRVEQRQLHVPVGRQLGPHRLERVLPVGRGAKEVAARIGELQAADVDPECRVGQRRLRRRWGGARRHSWTVRLEGPREG